MVQVTMIDVWYPDILLRDEKSAFRYSRDFRIINFDIDFIKSDVAKRFVHFLDPQSQCSARIGAHLAIRTTKKTRFLMKGDSLFVLSVTFAIQAGKIVTLFPLAHARCKSVVVNE